MNKAFAFLAAVSIAAVVPGAATAATDGKNRHITVRNLSSQAIYYLYASPVTSDTWEEDLLGDNVVMPGRNLDANIDNGTNECMYDLKAVMANDKEYIKRRVNVCAASTWSIGDRGDSID